MAQLTAADYRQLRKSVYSVGAGKEEIKALPGGVPSEAKILDMFQDLEDDTVSHFATQQSIIETALGVTPTLPLEKKIMVAYYLWKIEQLKL